MTAVGGRLAVHRCDCLDAHAAHAHVIGEAGAEPWWCEGLGWEESRRARVHRASVAMDRSGLSRGDRIRVVLKDPVDPRRPGAVEEVAFHGLYVDPERGIGLLVADGGGRVSNVHGPSVWAIENTQTIP